MSPDKRHPADAVSLVFGIVFVGIALSWLLLAVGVLRVEDLGWVLPPLLIGAGFVGMLASRNRR